MLKSVAPTLCLLMVSSQIAYAHQVTPQEQCQAELKCIIEKSEGILNNLAELEQNLESGNRKLVHALAKQCTSTTKQIGMLLNLLTQEIGLAPNPQSVKNVLLSRLEKDVENNKIYTGSTSLENEDFKTTLYVMNYTSAPPTKDLDVRQIGIGPNPNRNRLNPALEAEWSKVTGQGKVQSWWFSGNRIYYAFSFSASPSKLQGLFILDRELDYHTITEECSDSQASEKDVTKS